MVIEGSISLPNKAEIFSQLGFLTIPNPEYVKAVQRKNFWRAKKLPKEISFFSVEGDTIVAPRNSILFFDEKPTETVTDKRVERASEPLKFKGNLRDYQLTYLDQDFPDDHVKNVPCGHGKTIMQIHEICRKGQKTCIIVPTKKLAKQWVKEVKEFVDGGRVFSLENTDKKLKKDNIFINYYRYDIIIINIDVLLYYILRAEQTGFLDYFGMLVFDEAHTVGAPTYHSLIEKFPAKYRIALTATYRRKDGMLPILQAHFGKTFEMEKQPEFSQVTVVPYSIPETKKLLLNGTYATNLTELTLYPPRIKAMCEIIDTVVSLSRTLFVISSRKQILEDLYELYNKKLRTTIILGKGEVKEAENPQLILGIDRLAGAGIDIPKSDTLLLITPMEDIEQAIGRINRIFPDKKDSVALFPYDHSICIATYRKMKKQPYNNKGITHTSPILYTEIKKYL